MSQIKIYLYKLRKKHYWLLDKINKKRYKESFLKYLSKMGINVDQSDPQSTWICPNTFFDSSNYSLLTIGNHVIVSFDCVILVHDTSIVTAAYAEEAHATSVILKPVIIGNNVFIGARSIILPGTEIGNNVIIGAGSVVKGKILSDSVYAGNPAKRICSIQEYSNKHKHLLIFSKDQPKNSETYSK